MKKKVVIFGGGTVGKMVYKKIKDVYDVLYAIDNDEKKHGTYLIDTVSADTGVQIKSGKDLMRDISKIDYVVIASYTGLDEMHNQLVQDFSVDETKIIRKYVESAIIAKFQFLESFSKIVYKNNIAGDVAEIGCFRGEFAKEINRFFPDRKLYLYDTFEGYDAKDLEVEAAHGCSDFPAGHLSITSPELVMKKMPYPKQVTIRKGYFPETFDLKNVSFCFVNIDVDLYQPTVAALNIIYPLLVKGGIVVIHDYFFEHVKSAVAVAVAEFAKQNNLSLFPIGDGISIAIIKQF